MKTSREAKILAKDLGLSEVDAYIMDLKMKLYTRAASLIKSSKFTHTEIAKQIGTSRSRINRISNYGENNVSIEILIKLIAILEGKHVIRIAA